MKKKFLTICAILLGSVSMLTAQVKLQTNNVDEVLKAMTLEEKAMLVVGGNRQIASSSDNGMIGSHAQRVPGAAGMTQAIPRLGIPSTVLTDGPAGVRINPKRDNDQNTYFCTGFPVGLPSPVLGTQSSLRRWVNVSATRCWNMAAMYCSRLV